MSACVRAWIRASIDASAGERMFAYTCVYFYVGVSPCVQTTVCALVCVHSIQVGSHMFPVMAIKSKLITG